MNGSITAATPAVSPVAGLAIEARRSARGKKRIAPITTRATAKGYGHRSSGSPETLINRAGLMPRP
jgi:hypothetical protein